ncbi:hypothetical protein [Olivibacter jilunii]|uniref:hypothetical protein n=1 Tax=Olivibacter jilunii TaxID=985016 RepID=UPI00103276CA|nr:hypothetical protein [Olivibacter jilunii]
MNMKNWNFLERQMKDIGFQPETIAQVKINISEGIPNFTAREQVELKDGDVRVTKPNLTKAKEGDMYWLNNYSQTLISEQGRKVNETLVYVDKSHNLTLDEVTKIQRGAGIEREMLDKQQNPYIGWSAIDERKINPKHGIAEVKPFHPNFGFSAEAAVKQYAIALPEDGLERLRQGERVKGIGEHDGKEYLVAVNPPVKSLFIWHADSNVALTKNERQELRADGMTEGEKASNAQSQRSRQSVGMP